MTDKKKNLLYFFVLLNFIMISGSLLIYGKVNGSQSVFKYFLKFVETASFIAITIPFYKLYKVNVLPKIKISGLDIGILSLLANYKIIYIYANNVTEIGFLIFFAVLLFCILLYLIVYWILKLIIKSDIKALYLSLLIIILIHALGFQYKGMVLCGCIYIDTFMLISSILALILLIKLISPKNLMRLLKNITIILLIFSGINIFPGLYSMRSSGLNMSYALHTKSCSRDIYIILLDMYSGKDTLETLGFDNSKFYKELRKRKFKVFENFYSNYNKTVYTLPSVLNGDYLNNIPMRTPSEAVNKSRLFNLAKHDGYKICYLNSWPISIHLETFRYYKYYNFYNYYNFQGNLIKEILATFFSQSLLRNLFYTKDERPTLLEDFIDDVLKIEQKKFVFLHFLMPHAPYAYDDKGTKIDGLQTQDFYNKDGSRSLNTKAFIGYTKYANDYTLNLVDKILSSSDSEPVILIFGDHGVRKRYYEHNEKPHMGELLKDKEYLKAHFNTFLAYYNPEEDTVLQNTRTLVNFFRVFTNNIFGTNLPVIKDKKFYSYYDSPVPLKEITGFWID